MLICVLLGTRLKAEACPMSATCMSNSKIITCGTRHGLPAGTHYYYSANGYKFICGVTDEVADHTITCSGCGLHYDNEQRVCNTFHSACGALPQYYLCQYQ